MSLGTINQSLRESLKHHEIIPDVIDDFTPTALLSVEYPASNVQVSLGNTISPSDAQEVPKIRITPDEHDDAVFTVVMTDPDAPSREDPKWSEFCHWIVTGLKPDTASASDPSTPRSVDTSKGHELIGYMGPAPPPKTGKHRYVILLYKDGNTTKMKGPPERKKWGNHDYRRGARQWAEKYDLKLVGANFFFAQNKSQ
ncbi:phosphatidylethanolamine-binding protein [Sphaerosporella brunnea]|uniref:Phosphatidylethanolamine-binding protein n=1 Tax=Sphaerosporella brunnea TaxID=1250544 RepID=A0A5J5F107_9PEZI|nr:phosphatidylethanolamine-binding protein [Sphaerosporella brunnea]